RDLGEIPGLDSRPLVLEPLYVACPASRWTDNDIPIDLQELEEERIIMLPHEVAPSMRLNIEDLLHSAGVHTPNVMEALAFPTALGLVASGMGIAIVPASVLAVQMPGLIYRPIAHHGAASQVSLVTVVTHQGPLLQKFLDAADNSMQQPNLNPTPLRRGGPAS